MRPDLRRVGFRGNSRRQRRLPAAFTLFVSLCVALAACAQPWRTVDEQSASLDGVVLAIYFSPQSYTWGPPGHVVLVHEDGSSVSLRTSGMDVASLVWSASGLYFSDTERDYLLRASLESWESPKANMQEAAFQTPSGIFISLFNDGWNEDGTYTEQVVVNDGTSSRRYDVQGYNEVVALCGEQIFAVAELTGEENTAKAKAEGVRVAEGMPQMLTQIYPQPDRKEGTYRAGYFSEMVGYLTSDEACTDDGVIHYLLADFKAYTSDETLMSYAVRSWNTRTGEASQKDLVDMGGAILPISDEAFALSVARTWISEGGGLVWIGGDGVVRRTDVVSGATIELWSHGRALGSGVTASFTADELFILEPDPHEPADLILSAYDVDTGEGGQILTVPGLAAIETIDQVRRDFAVKPGWNPKQRASEP